MLASLLSPRRDGLLAWLPDPLPTVPVRLERPRLRPHRRGRLLRLRGPGPRARLRLHAEPARLPPAGRPPREGASRRRVRVHRRADAPGPLAGPPPPGGKPGAPPRSPP